LIKFKYFAYRHILQTKIINSIYKIPVNNEHVYAPFFIIGSGRSGNTLLRRILQNHDELYIPPETYVLRKIIVNYYKNPFLDWNELIEQVLSTFEEHPEFETFKLNNLNDLRKYLEKIDKEKRSLATLVNSFYEYYKLEHNLNGSIWGDKTPANVFCLDDLNTVFPRSKFIHIIRNPFDSISSYIKSGIYSNVNDATVRWVSAVELSCEFGRKNPHQYMEVLYSELVSNPKDVTSKLCEFLGVDYQESMLNDNGGDLGDVSMHAHHANVHKKINTKSLGKGLKELNESDKELILKVLSVSKEPIIINFSKAVQINLDV
jgi:protein-tyrosine sulfotransferase